MVLNQDIVFLFPGSLGPSVSVHYWSSKGNKVVHILQLLPQPFHPLHGAQVFAQVMHELYLTHRSLPGGNRNRKDHSISSPLPDHKANLRNPIPMPSPCRRDYNTYLTGFPSDFARKQIANMTIITLTMSFVDIIFTKRKREMEVFKNIFNILNCTIKFIISYPYNHTTVQSVTTTNWIGFHERLFRIGLFYFTDILVYIIYTHDLT